MHNPETQKKEKQNKKHHTEN